MSFHGIEEKQYNQLVATCQKLKERAYCPYSKFRVGCSILTEDGYEYFILPIEKLAIF